MCNLWAWEFELFYLGAWWWVSSKELNKPSSFPAPCFLTSGAVTTLPKEALSYLKTNIPTVNVIEYEVNRGKGYALRKGVAEAKQEASDQATILIENAKATIKQEQQAAVAELKKKVADLSIGIAETVVKKELASQDDQLKLVEDMLQDVTLN